ncbi:MAG: hypothetical protein ACTJF0_02730 [Psychroflexus halocasei]
MSINNTNSLKSVEQNHRLQDTKKEVFKAQRKTIFTYLKDHTATASMVADATGIPQKNICRYKRDLEKAGKLWETEKKLCKKTGFRAWYLTTKPEFFNNLKNR